MGMQFLKPREYQIHAGQIYNELRTRLLTVLPDAEIEHIGSSAIRGALSKGDLDVLVRVPRERFAQAIEAIQSFGFSIKDGTLRTQSLCMLEGENNTAIQLIEAGSEFEMFVRFRDKMNSEPSLVEKYNQLKLDSTGMIEEEYRARKSKFIEAVLRGTF
jgi:GrpB-like predicted nucleotidyltransferase (UPF0157 family)